jgi:hypothetical protein
MTCNRRPVANAAHGTQAVEVRFRPGNGHGRTRTFRALWAPFLRGGVLETFARRHCCRVGSVQLAIAPGLKPERRRLVLCIRAGKQPAGAETFGSGERWPPKTKPSPAAASGRASISDELCEWQSCARKTYSDTIGFAGCRALGRRAGLSSMSSSLAPGVGDGASVWAMKGALCGNGDMSIISTQPGDDEGGRGGVVKCPAHASHQFPDSHDHSHRRHPGLPRASNASIMVAVVKRARRGVGNIGLLVGLGQI